MICTYENGKIVGEGEKYYSDGGVYKGELSHNGLPHGKGVWELPDGSRYEGEHDMGFRHGKGVLILPDGTRQVGRFEKDNYFGPEDEPSLMASSAVENWVNDDANLQKVGTSGGLLIKVDALAWLSVI